MTREEGIEGAVWATDRYTQALESVIHAKAEGTKPPSMEAEEAPASQVVDLMSALEQSVQRARVSRGETDADVHELKPRKKVAKKPAQKKSVAKKTGSGKPRRSA
ncbi:hypothetical protein [Streptomyces alboflavus]|uniref:hypothetical protein n=1 Tax=Streptomyces alboflavus TaxID=67267 RepID=UPI0036A66B38